MGILRKIFGRRSKDTDEKVRIRAAIEKTRSHMDAKMPRYGSAYKTLLVVENDVATIDKRRKNLVTSTGGRR